MHGRGIRPAERRKLLASRWVQAQRRPDGRGTQRNMAGLVKDIARIDDSRLVDEYRAMLDVETGEIRRQKRRRGMDVDADTLHEVREGPDERAAEHERRVYTTAQCASLHTCSRSF